MSDKKPSVDFDDIPPGMHGSMSAHEFFEVYKTAKAVAKQLPKMEGISDTEKVSILTREFQSSSPDRKALFRKATDAKDALAIYWLARCRLLAKSSLSLRESRQPFGGVSADRMAQIAKFSVYENRLNELPDLLWADGIIMVLEPALAGMKVDGAAFRLEDGTPVVALSLRHDRLDNFWFTLMHELAHVSLHYHLLSAPIVDDLDDAPADLIEKQADRLGANSLIHRSDWNGNDALYSQPNGDHVVALALKLKIHPAIVAGRIRKQLNNYKLFNDIVHRVSLRKVYFNEK